MVEVEGGPLGGESAEEICTRQGAAISNYDGNIQKNIEKEVAETVNINLMKEEIKEEAEEEHPAAGGLSRKPTVASRTNIVVYCDNLQDKRAWTNITHEILLSDVKKIILSSVAIPDKLEVLKNEEIWVADRGATNYCSKSARRGINIREASVTAQGITGPAMSAESKMDLPSIICNQYGQEQLRVTLTNVSCRKCNNFNLFSVGPCLINGWKLSGDSKGLELTKGKKKIRLISWWVPKRARCIVFL